jgi:hypothetical protein
MTHLRSLARRVDRLARSRELKRLRSERLALPDQFSSFRARLTTGAASDSDWERWDAWLREIGYPSSLFGPESAMRNIQQVELLRRLNLSVTDYQL